MRTKLKLLAVAAICASAPAWGASSASATLGPLQVVLFDLNPLDGINPTLTFASGNGSYAYSYAYVSLPYGFDAQSNFGVDSWGAVSAASLVSLAQSYGALTGPGTVQGSTLTATGSASAPNSTYAFDLTYYESGAYNYGGQNFTLSDNTLLLVTGSASISGSVTGGQVSPYSAGEYASAGSLLQLYGPSASGSNSGSQNSSEQLYNSINGPTTFDGTNYTMGSASFSNARNFAVSFANSSGGDLNGTLYAQTVTYGYSYANVTAVPEPGGYALLLAGLGVIGMVARSRSTLGA